MNYPGKLGAGGLMADVKDIPQRSLSPTTWSQLVRSPTHATAKGTFRGRVACIGGFESGSIRPAKRWRYLAKMKRTKKIH